MRGRGGRGERDGETNREVEGSIHQTLLEGATIHIFINETEFLCQTDALDLK